MIDVACLSLALLLAPQSEADLAAKTDAVFSEWNRTDSPGCAVAVYRDGKIVFAKGYGMASVELSAPITPRTTFDIGSTSKQFTAACIVLLAQDGKLALEDDIRKHVPEMPEYEAPITIRHLLNHTSGLRDYIELMTMAGSREQDRTTSTEALAIIARQRGLNFPPGSKHLYSNTGYFLLAQIVERVSGKSMREFARERIFAPLGMRHTEVLDDCTRILPNKASSYEPGAAFGSRERFAVHSSNWEQTGDGAVQTTVEDLLLWDENFYTGKVGGAALRETLTTRGALNDGTQLDYCAGLMLGRHRGLEIVSHGGAWAGFRAELVRVPNEHLSVACLCNLGSMDASRLALAAVEVWLAEKLADEPVRSVPAESESGATTPPREVVVSASDLAGFTGTYAAEELVVQVTLSDGALSILGPNVRPGALVPIGPNRFQRENAPRPVEVVFEKEQMRFEYKNGEVRALHRIEPWTPDAAELARYAGAYWSEEIGAPIVLAVQDGVLTAVEHRTLAGMRLEPFTLDRFNCGLGRVVFSTAENAVNGFRVDGGRAKGLHFVKR